MDIFGKTKAGKKVAISRLGYVEAIMKVTEEIEEKDDAIRSDMDAIRKEMDALKERIEALEQANEEGKADENL